MRCVPRYPGWALDQVLEIDVRKIGRTGKGVIGIRLDEGNEVVGMEIVRDDSTILTVTENGYGKRSTLETTAARAGAARALSRSRSSRRTDG